MTDPTTTPASTPAVRRKRDALAREYLDLKAARAAADERMKAIEAEFRTALTEFGNYGYGNAKVQIARNVQQDKAAILEAFPATEFPHFYKPAIDSTALKRGLTGEQYESFQTLGEAKVIITVIEDEA
jgi:hypothetical protein